MPGHRRGAIRERQDTLICCSTCSGRTCRCRYRFLVFSTKTTQPSYEMRAVEQSQDSGAANFFIRKVQISKSFNGESRRKFQVQTSEGILLVDSGEKEYEAEVYFWANSPYQHEPVDY